MFSLTFAAFHSFHCISAPLVQVVNVLLRCGWNGWPKIHRNVINTASAFDLAFRIIKPLLGSMSMAESIGTAIVAVLEVAIRLYDKFIWLSSNAGLPLVRSYQYLASRHSMIERPIFKLVRRISITFSRAIYGLNHIATLVVKSASSLMRSIYYRLPIFNIWTLIYNLTSGMIQKLVLIVALSGSCLSLVSIFTSSPASFNYRRLSVHPHEDRSPSTGVEVSPVFLNTSRIGVLFPFITSDMNWVFRSPTLFPSS